MSSENSTTSTVESDSTNTVSDAIEELMSALDAVGESRATILAMCGFDSVDVVADAAVYDIKKLPCFGEKTARDAVISARECRDDETDDDADIEEREADETDDDDDADGGASDEDVPMNEVELRCTPETTVAVVAPDGHFEGMNNRQTRAKVFNAIGRSPFEPTGIRAVSDFEGTEIDASIHLHNVYSSDDEDELNRYEAVETPWDEIDEKPDDEIGQKTDADGQVVHQWWTKAHQARDDEILDTCDAIVALSDGGYVGGLLEKATDAGVDVWDDRARTHLQAREQAEITAFDDEQLREGHQGALDEDEARENPRSEVENTW